MSLGGLCLGGSSTLWTTLPECQVGRQARSGPVNAVACAHVERRCDLNRSRRREDGDRNSHRGVGRTYLNSTMTDIGERTCMWSWMGRSEGSAAALHPTFTHRSRLNSPCVTHASTSNGPNWLKIGPAAHLTCFFYPVSSFENPGVLELIIYSPPVPQRPSSTLGSVIIFPAGYCWRPRTGSA